jgi:hypothetical protein
VHTGRNRLLLRSARLVRLAALAPLSRLRYRQRSQLQRLLWHSRSAKQLLPLAFFCTHVLSAPTSGTPSLHQWPEPQSGSSSQTQWPLARPQPASVDEQAPLPHSALMRQESPTARELGV